MNAHVSTIPLGVRDIDRTNPFYARGLAWRGAGPEWCWRWTESSSNTTRPIMWRSSSSGR
jgi:hypothetical protein